MRNSLILPDRPLLDSGDVSRIREDYERFREGLPERIEAYLLETYGLDVSARYGLRAIRNPFGKASGQLSLNVRQVQEDCRARLGFVVLKTVIAEDADGGRSMKEWAVKETRMVVGRITGKETGETGWNVTWQGRGWHGSFGDYLAFFRKALDIGNENGTVVVPSCKYHLPGGEDEEFRLEEYEYTTRRLHGVWRQSGAEGPLQMEKDFSPTLAGSGRARQQTAVLRWLREVPDMIKSSLPPGEVALGIKLMNTIFDDEFQIRALRTLIEESSTPPDYITYANRLYDQVREFGGKIGAAYGGPDLSRRNLRILSLLRKLELEGELACSLPPLSGTGNVCTGKMALEYALHGVKSLQMHTVFQKPAGAYSMRRGGKTERALHDLFFHPEHGLVPWMLHLRHAQEIRDPEGITSFLDITEWYRERGRSWFLGQDESK